MCIQHQVTTLRNPLLTLSPWCKKLFFCYHKLLEREREEGRKI
jgi:hypothetical protein